MNSSFGPAIIILWSLCRQGLAFVTPTDLLTHSRISVSGRTPSRNNSLPTLAAQISDHDKRNSSGVSSRSPEPSKFSRRTFLTHVAYGIPASSILGQTHDANAAPPLTAEMADNVSARLERALRPKPPKVLRARLNLDFAVLLMRSSYNAVDAIDVVLMDQFQRDFFLIRQAEYQNYANALGPGAMQQGDLADPNYFDFISFAQYSTICREINDPAVFFEEQQPVEVGEGEAQQFVKVVVKRDSSLTNSDLTRRHTEIVGNAILDKLNEKFSGTPSAIPEIELGSTPDASTLLASIKQMVNLFVISGFAWDGAASISKLGKVQNDASGTEFTIVVTSPATLWSGQALKVRCAIFLYRNCVHFSLVL
eukprot:CCRYP_011058-RD/>CCRYP_011058-RD protein AED:0.12 eAED:0.12 QI:513/1/1/1/0/0/3/336/365